MSAPLCALFRPGRAVWLLATIICWLAFLFAAFCSGRFWRKVPFPTNGQLAGPLGHRVPGRCAQRLYAGAGRVGGRGRHQLLPADCRAAHPVAGIQAALVLHRLYAVFDRPAGHHHHRRRFQCLRISRNFFTVQLCVDQHWPRPPGADRRLSIPDHGYDRRNVHSDQHRPDVCDDRDAEHG